MTHRKGVRGAFTAAIVAGAGLFGSNAIAEDFVIEEVVVTATKRSAAIRDVSFSINAGTARARRYCGVDGWTCRACRRATRASGLSQSALGGGT